MKKLVCAAICTVAFVGFVMADEFQAQITKVDGNTIHFKKGFGGFGGGGGGGGKKGGGGGGGGDVKEESAKATADVKVAKGEFDTAGGGGGGGGKKGGGGGKGGFAVKAGDPIEKGLKNEMFTKIEEGKGVQARITTNDKGEVTEVLVIQGFGGGGFGKKKGG